jgi:sodium/hydrogen exchanger-like protein 6/7
LKGKFHENKISAYNLRKKEFFRNLGTILTFAFLGTTISILIIGIFMWLFGNIGIFQVFKK